MFIDDMLAHVPACKGWMQLDTDGSPRPYTKAAKINGGFEIQVPLFINQGDTIKIDTRTGEYADRVLKK